MGVLHNIVYACDMSYCAAVHGSISGIPVPTVVFRFGQSWLRNWGVHGATTRSICWPSGSLEPRRGRERAGHVKHQLAMLCRASATIYTDYTEEKKQMSGR